MTSFQATCLALAKSSILSYLNKETLLSVSDTRFEQQKACFVTLKTHRKHLRGCIGSLIPYRKLKDDIIANAQAAAFHDPRFNPVTYHELESVPFWLEITILSPMIEKNFSDKKDLYEFLEKEKCGLVIKYGYYQATFLPSVWHELPTPSTFVQHLLWKAGIDQEKLENDFKNFTFLIYYGEEFGNDREKIQIPSFHT